MAKQSRKASEELSALQSDSAESDLPNARRRHQVHTACHRCYKDHGRNAPIRQLTDSKAAERQNLFGMRLSPNYFEECCLQRVGCVET